MTKMAIFLAGALFGGLLVLGYTDDSVRERVLNSASNDGERAEARAAPISPGDSQGHNAVAWDAAYEGKRVAISGQVTKVGLADSGLLSQLGLAGYYGYVEIKDEDDAGIWGAKVVCTFSKNDREQFAELRKGHIVKLSGVATSDPTTSTNCSDVEITGIQY